MSVRLPLASLGPFFEARHLALASRLEAGALSPLAGEHDAAEVARAMGSLAVGERGEGLYGYLVPEAHGGAHVGREGDIDVRALVVLRDALAQVSALADAIFAVQGLAARPLVLAGSDAQRAELLPALVRGERIGAFALTEPEAGSDVAALATRAHDDGDAWVLEGEKCFLSNVPLASYATVFATVDPALGRKGISAFAVELDAAARGLSVEPMPMSSPHPLGRLRFDGLRVPKRALVGERGQGFKLAMQTLDAFRITVGGAACGMAARALSSALAHTAARRQFGRPLSEQDLVRGMLADMATELDASRLLVARAAWLRDERGERVSTEAAMAKMFSTEAAQRVVDRAVQLHGGKGVLLGTDVEALYRDVRPLRIYEGATEVQKLVIAKGLLERRS